jgi:hypothetical protein
VPQLHNLEEETEGSGHHIVRNPLLDGQKNPAMPEVQQRFLEGRTSRKKHNPLTLDFENRRTIPTIQHARLFKKREDRRETITFQQSFLL